MYLDVNMDFSSLTLTLFNIKMTVICYNYNFSYIFLGGKFIRLYRKVVWTCWSSLKNRKLFPTIWILVQRFVFCFYLCCGSWLWKILRYIRLSFCTTLFLAWCSNLRSPSYVVKHHSNNLHWSKVGCWGLLSSLLHSLVNCNVTTLDRILQQIMLTLNMLNITFRQKC